MNETREKRISHKEYDFTECHHFIVDFSAETFTTHYLIFLWEAVQHVEKAYL